jgi:hypothetical protein
MAKLQPRPKQHVDPDILAGLDQFGWWFPRGEGGVRWDDAMRRVQMGKDWFGHGSLADFVRDSLRNIFRR